MPQLTDKWRHRLVSANIAQQFPSVSEEKTGFDFQEKFWLPARKIADESLKLNDPMTHGQFHIFLIKLIKSVWCVVRHIQLLEIPEFHVVSIFFNEVRSVLW